LYPGARAAVADRRGDEPLVRLGQRGDAGAGVHRDAGALPPEQLAPPRVQARPDLDPEGLDRVANRHAAADRARRPVERGEEPVAGRVDLPAAEAVKLAADRRVVALEQLTPAP